MIQHHAIRRRDNPVYLGQGSVRTVVQGNFPQPAGSLGDGAQPGSQTSAVADRPIQQPVTTHNTRLRERLADQSSRAVSLGDLTVRAVQTGHVSHASIATNQNHSTRQRRLNGDEHVVAIEPQLASRKRRKGQLGSRPVLALVKAARTARHGHPLPLIQPIPITRQRQGRRQRVSTIQEPI